MNGEDDQLGMMLSNLAPALREDEEFRRMIEKLFGGPKDGRRIPDVDLDAAVERDKEAIARLRAEFEELTNPLGTPGVRTVRQIHSREDKELVPNPILRAAAASQGELDEAPHQLEALEVVVAGVPCVVALLDQGVFLDAAARLPEVKVKIGGWVFGLDHDPTPDQPWRYAVRDSAWEDWIDVEPGTEIELALTSDD